MSEDMVKAMIGAEYVNGVFSSENSDFVGMAYREIARINAELFKLIPYEVEFTDDDPYESAKQMRGQVSSTGKIRIYTGWSGHPFLTQEENNISRAVHDVLAHMVCGCPFNFVGEYNAYLTQREYYPEWTWAVLFAEIPAQTCAYYYSESFDFHQRAINAPSHWLKWCESLKRDYSANSVLSIDSLVEHNI
jgi:hypothetical protein